MPPSKRRPPLPKSPVTSRATPQAERLGRTALSDEPRRVWSLATVLDNNPGTQTYSISTAFGPLENVPRLMRDPGETSILPRNTEVVIHDELGYYVIDSILKLPVDNAVELQPTPVTEIEGVGGADAVYATDGSAPTYRSPNDPKQVLSGDWVHKSPDGNLVGVLAGGVNVLQSGPFAQVRTHALEEIVEILSRQFRHVTGMGDLTIQKDNQGKMSLVWRAGADEVNETGANRGHWTIWLDVGATGDMVKLRVTTPQGNTLSEIHMDANGGVAIKGTAGVDISSGDRGTSREDVGGDKEIKIQGESRAVVKGKVTQTYRAGRKTTVSKNDSLIVGNSLMEQVNTDRNVVVGGNFINKVRAGLGPVVVPGQIGLQWDVVNGSVETVVGDPLKAAIPTALQSINFINYVGNVNFVAMPTAVPPAGGFFNVFTTLPGSVNLGVTGAAVPDPTIGGHRVPPAISVFGAMKFEPFYVMMAVLLTWLDTHVHTSAVGPTSPPMVPSTPLVMSFMMPIRSVRVTIGL